MYDLQVPHAGPVFFCMVFSPVWHLCDSAIAILGLQKIITAARKPGRKRENTMTMTMDLTGIVFYAANFMKKEMAR